MRACTPIAWGQTLGIDRLPRFCIMPPPVGGFGCARPLPCTQGLDVTEARDGRPQ